MSDEWTDSPEDWTISPEPPSGAGFKWGLNGETNQLTVWEVGGPGDGFPSHADYLIDVWGRDDHHRPGDLLGAAYADNGTVTIVIYTVPDGGTVRADLPPQLLAWAQTTFPGHQIGRGQV